MKKGKPSSDFPVCMGWGVLSPIDRTRTASCVVPGRDVTHYTRRNATPSPALTGMGKSWRGGLSMRAKDEEGGEAEAGAMSGAAVAEAAFAVSSKSGMPVYAAGAAVPGDGRAYTGGGGAAREGATSGDAGATTARAVRGSSGHVPSRSQPARKTLICGCVRGGGGDDDEERRSCWSIEQGRGASRHAFGIVV